MFFFFFEHLKLISEIIFFTIQNNPALKNHIQSNQCKKIEEREEEKKLLLSDYDCDSFERLINRLNESYRIHNKNDNTHPR